MYVSKAQMREESEKREIKKKVDKSSPRDAFPFASVLFFYIHCFCLEQVEGLVLNLMLRTDS